MSAFRSILLLASALSATSLPSLTHAVPASASALEPRQTAAASSYWLANMDHSQDTVWGNSNGSYQVFRDVTKYGVDPTGQQDAADLLNNLISADGRCGWGCNESTITPAIIYFPPGKYLVSKPVQLAYYTQLIGDPTNMPTIVATSDFSGMAVFDADPYHYPEGDNWFTNQNNFFRQIRNFVMDFTSSADTTTGIHWQVAQATSLQNIVFKMKEGSQQQGVFMDNGSGGFFSDLIFSGGKVGAFLGSQQFTSRNLTFTNCETAIFMNWNWGWTLSNIYISGSSVGLDMSNSPANQTVGSVLLTDSTITNTKYGVATSFGGNGTSGQVPAAGGTLIIDNVDMTGVTTASVWQNATSSVLLAPNQHITTYAQGNGYDHATSPTKLNGALAKAPVKNKLLLDDQGRIFGRSKPQYADVAASNFKSVKTVGKCKGDGSTDDTKCIQDFLNTVASDSSAIAYFDHGAYLVSDTIKVPNKIKIVGCIWPTIMANGPSFNDANNPKPVFQVGDPQNPSGAVEISDLIFQTKGPAPGAIMVEWNLHSDAGASGMWDTHVRIGGSYGTGLQVEQCPGWPTFQPTPTCYGVFLMFHATNQSAGVYLENTWFWVADHDLESANQTQISIYSGRGVLVNSQGPTWLWGTASEHSALYNYQLDGVQAFFGGFMQSETPYYQPSPVAPKPFAVNAAYGDPNLSIYNNGTAAYAWGLRVAKSTGVLVYATGMYSFFQNYNQACVLQQNCQQYMIRIEQSQVSMYTVTTKAAVNMIADDAFQNTPILAEQNRGVYGDTLAYYASGSQ